MSAAAFDGAARLVKRYGTRDPFDIISEARNTKLWLTDAFKKDGLKGFATIQNRVRYAVVNSLLEPEEQRVVAAHELGHIVMHAARLSVCPMRDFQIYEAAGRFERDANFFAADLLIDDNEALELIRSPGADFFSVAKALSVPAPFFAFKLYSLVERGYPMSLPVELNSRFLKNR